MLSTDLNELFTRVGPGTRMGRLMRCYWYPVAVVSEFETRWTKRVRLLGEDLVLFKDRTGRFGLLEEQCPHRRASLYYGIPTEQGIRCPYHGWHLDRLGRCVDQPNEARPDALKGKELTTAYEVEEMGGMLWAYIGEQPAPLLPRFDGFVTEHSIRTVGRSMVPANWLQIMENSLDPVHTEWLHGKTYEFLKEGEGVKVPISRHHVKIAFDEFEFGIIKRRLLEGQSEDSDDWTVGHPVVFPYTLSVGNGNPESRTHNFQIRVPVDDTHTEHLWYTAYVLPRSIDIPARLKERVTLYDVPFVDANGDHIIDFVDGQDIMAWVTQGAIADRSKEMLGATDAGVVAFRRMCERELAKAERGEDPIGVIRDVKRNGLIELPVERNKFHYSEGFEMRIERSQSRYSPINADVVALMGAAREQIRAASGGKR